MKSLMQMVDTAAVDSIVYEQVSGSGLAAEHGIPSLATGMFVGNYDANDVYRTVDVVMDVDRNGWPDFLNLAGGNAWLNYGDNRFYKCSLGGQILAVKDLTGDGVPDYLIYDSRGQIVQLVCYDAGGHVMRRDLVQGLVVTAAWCYDFDRNGDADILLAFDYTASQAYSVLIFCRNNGDGTFTRNMADEYFFPETLQFIDCVDIDNNGLYEVVGYDRSDEVFRVIDCSDSFVATMQEQPLAVTIDTFDENLFIGDLDGDGRIEYSGADETDRYIYMICKFAGAVNTAPQQMAKPSAVYDDSRQMLNVQWAAGSDGESSPVDLTYALRIGTEPGKGDILYAHALADGTRRNLLDGNMGHNLNHWVNVGCWKPGTYYIAVQAVDPNHRGGAWSEELVYEHASIGSGFELDRLEMTTADTLTISFPGISAEGYECQWELGNDAIVISEAPGHIQLAYATLGSRDISLAVTDGQGRTSATTIKTVTVYPVDMEERSLEFKSGFFADWNSDGFMDFVARDGFYQNDGTGGFAKATGSFNMNLVFDEFANEYSSGSYMDNAAVGIMDYNMDGLPDLFASSNKGDTFLNTSADGRMLFDARGSGSGLLGKNSISNVLWADLDNDGDLDVYYDYYNNVTYEEIVCNDGHLTFGDADIFRQWRTGYSVLAFYDVDSDGWIDILGYERDNYGENWVFVVDKNKGNWVFERVATSLHEDDHRLMDAFATMADMDGDGYADAVCLETDRRVRIYYGDAGMTYARTSEVLLPIECDGISLLHDVDNDGTIDIVLTPYYRGISPYTQVVAYNSLAGSFSCQIMDDDVSEAHAYPVDLDGDGVPDWVQAKALGWWSYAKVSTRITNTAPQTPTNLRMRQTEEGVVLEWDAAVDKETPKSQMRYNVSVRGKGLTGLGAGIFLCEGGHGGLLDRCPGHGVGRLPGGGEPPASVCR